MIVELSERKVITNVKTVVSNIDWRSYSTYQRAVDVHRNTVVLIVFVKAENRIDKDSIK